MVHVKVTGARLLVKRDEAGEVSAGGILLPEQSREKPRTGRVVVTRPGARTRDGGVIPVCVKPGDQIIYADFSGVEIHDEQSGEAYTLLNERDVLAVLEG